MAERRKHPSSRVLKSAKLVLESSAQLSLLIDGVDWRAPERQWRRLLRDDRCD